MRVFMINSFFSVGGPPRIMNGIYTALKDNGYECKIAAAREKEYVPEDSIPIGNVLSVYRNALSARFLDNDGMNAKRYTSKLIRSIEQYNPDIIHLHNLHGYYINVEILFNFLKQCGKPIVWTLHDCWAMTGHCSYFTMAQCERWKTQCSHCPQKRSYPSSYIKDNSFLNYEKKKSLFTAVPNMTIVTPSAWLASIVNQSFLSEYPVSVIHNGIDLTVFKPTYGEFRKKYGLLDKVIILGVASVWDKRKGLTDFYKLSEILDDTYRIVLVGLSEKQKKSLPQKIIGITGTNNAEELAEIYTAADIFFNPTYEDNYPTTNLEAQACGTPCLTYRTGGSVESVPQENCIEVGNLDEVCSRIKTSLSLKKPVTSIADMLSDYLDIYHG